LFAFTDSFTDSASRGNQPPAGVGGLVPEVAMFAQTAVAGAVGGGRAHDDVVQQFHFQKLAGAD
jgi:hypothetical protein